MVLYRNKDKFEGDISKNGEREGFGVYYKSNGQIFYQGEWKNNLFIGGLSGSHIARLIINGHKVVGEERLLENKGERFRDITYLNGKLYTVTDSGKLYCIRKK